MSSKAVWIALLTVCLVALSMNCESQQPPDSIANISNTFPMRRSVEIKTKGFQTVVTAMRNDKQSPVFLQIKTPEGIEKIQLPELIIQRTMSGEIEDLRMTSFGRNSLAVVAQIGTGEDCSYWVLTIRKEIDTATGSSAFRLQHFFCLLEWTSELRLGEINNPEGDSLVATLFDPHPIPDAARHLMMVFRNDCPALSMTPFLVSFAYPSIHSLTESSRTAVTRVRGEP